MQSDFRDGQVLSSDLAELISVLPKDVCFSGGANGADFVWGETAESSGHTVVHWSFYKHRSDAPESTVFPIPQADLMLADADLRGVSKILRRNFPKDKYFIANLLRRNWFQVRWSDAIYAVGKLDSRGNIDGGTAWACSLFHIIYPTRPSFFFDQLSGNWYTRMENFWSAIPQPPRPTGWYAGVGTRDLNEKGKLAIQNLMFRS